MANQGGAPAVVDPLVTWVSAHLLQIQCKNENWFKKGNKIPKQVLSFILADLVPDLKEGVQLVGNRFIFVLDRHLSGRMDELIPLLVHDWAPIDCKGFTCEYQIQPVGQYGDLVQTIVKAWNQDEDDSVFPEDVFHHGYLEAIRDLDFRWLPPGFFMSTPIQGPDVVSPDPLPIKLKKMERGALEEYARKLALGQHIPPPAWDGDYHEGSMLAGHLPEAQPNLESVEPQHQPAVVKPKITTKEKDIPVNKSNVNLEQLQESLLQHSQAVVQTLAEKGLIQSKMQKLEVFTGSTERDRPSYNVWESQVLAASAAHDDATMLQAIRSCLKGPALEVVSFMDPSVHWTEIMDTLKVKFQHRASYDALMQDFYQLDMGPEDDCSKYGTKLEKSLRELQAQYPGKITNSSGMLADRFFHGLTPLLQAHLRPTFEKKEGYYSLMSKARVVETEMARGSKGSHTANKDSKSKSKVSGVASADPILQTLEARHQTTAQQMNRLQQTINDIGQRLQIDPNPQQAGMQPQALTQDPTPIAPTNPQGGQSNPPARRGGYRGTNFGGRGRGSFGRGSGRGNPNGTGRGYNNFGKGFSGNGNGRGRGDGLCFWCRGKVPDEQAGHLQRNCELWKTYRNMCFERANQNVQGTPPPTGTAPQEQGN